MGGWRWIVLDDVAIFGTSKCGCSPKTVKVVDFRARIKFVDTIHRAFFRNQGEKTYIY